MLWELLLESLPLSLELLHSLESSLLSLQPSELLVASRLARFFAFGLHFGMTGVSV